MSQNDTAFDEQALAEISKCLLAYSKEYREMIEAAVRKIGLNSGDWNDEDFNALLSAVASFREDADRLEQSTNRFCERINNRLDAIRQLHTMKVQGG